MLVLPPKASLLVGLLLLQLLHLNSAIELNLVTSTNGGAADADISSEADPRAGTTLVIFADSPGSNETVAPLATQVPTLAPTVAPPKLTPYNFTYIYFIGGVCSETSQFGWKETELGREFTAPNVSSFEWNSRFFAAGLEAFAGRSAHPDSVKHICAGPDEVAVSRDFHLRGLREVEQEVGSEINNTLIITLGENLDSDWSPVADLLRKGVAFFHGGYTGESVTMNLTEFGLSPDTVMYFYFRLEVVAAARRAGVELCRLKGGDQQIKIGLLTWAIRPDVLPRVEILLEAFKEACPDTDVQTVWNIDYSDKETAFKTALLFKELPDVALTFYDGAAKELLEVAEKILPEDEYARFATTGWDNMYPDLMKQKKILTTVDQMVFYPDRGLWDLETTIVGIMQESGYRTTRAVQKALDLGDTVEIVTDTHTVSSDVTGYLLNSLMRGYNKNALPSDQVKVSTGLYDISITEMIPFEGKFDAVLWLRVTWQDLRLAWNPFVHPGSLLIDPEEIWTPPLFFKNEFESDDLYKSPAVITNQGHVLLETNIKGTFLCATTVNLRAFPFDKYNCSIDLAAPEGIVLDASYGLKVISSDPHFTTQPWINETDGDSRNEHSWNDDVRYNLRFERRPFTGYVRLIMPAILINLIGFMAFWIPEAQESIALGITSLLCSLAFRDSIEMPDTAFVTWTEVFMLVNVTYQCSVMFIIWGSYGHQSAARCLNRICIRIHPRRMFKRAKRVQKRVAMSVRSSGRSNRTLKTGHVPSIEKARQKYGVEQSELSPLGNEDVDIEVPAGDVVRDLDVDVDDFANESIDVDDLGAKKDGDVPSMRDNSSKSGHSSVRFGANGGTVRQRRSNPNNSRGELAYGIAGDYAHLQAKDGTISTVYEDPNSVDWIGRWFILPSYIIVMASLVFTGWGFYDND